MPKNNTGGCYVFSASLRISTGESVYIDPNTFSVVLSWKAPQPGLENWERFREFLWRGQLNHPEFVISELTPSIDVPIESIQFSELQCTQSYLDSLQTAISNDLSLFNAESTTEVISKYFGSSIRVVEDIDDLYI